MNTAYTYRIAHADAARLTHLVSAHILHEAHCWTFGGALQWDFAPHNGQRNLRPIDRIATVQPEHLRGDFGHFFSHNAELRWKRRGLDDYDTLILSEQPLTIADATLIGTWTTSTNRHYHILQDEEHKPLCYIAYHAANGAILFQRFTEVQA